MERPTSPRRGGPAGRRRADSERRTTVEVDGAPAKGPEDAAVTLVEFSDFQCPFCRRVTPTLEQIRETYGDEVRLVFKHLPLTIHPKAPAAHAAAEAAHRQDRFWEMHDRIFENQGDMSEAAYRTYAEEIGLDLERFERDRRSAEVRQRVQADAAEAARLGVTGTPTFFVNGREISGAKPFAAFQRLIDAELEESS